MKFGGNYEIWSIPISLVWMSLIHNNELMVRLGTFELFEAPSEKWQKGGEVVSQFRPNFTMSAKFHNFSQISQFRQNFTILTRFHNFDQISQLRQNFTISANQEYLAFLKYLEYLEYIRVRAVSQFLRCFLQR